MRQIDFVFRVQCALYPSSLIEVEGALDPIFEMSDFRINAGLLDVRTPVANSPRHDAHDSEFAFDISHEGHPVCACMQCMDSQMSTWTPGVMELDP